jgi:hypothetical protein
MLNFILLQISAGTVVTDTSKKVAAIASSRHPSCENRRHAVAA